METQSSATPSRVGSSALVFVALLGLASPGSAAGDPAPAPAAVPAGKGDERVRTLATKHYQIWTDATQVEAEEMGLVLEEAWKQFAVQFAAEPSGAKRLKLKQFETEDAFLHAAWSDGATVPAQCRPAFFSQESRILYVFGRPTNYTTRQALIFGAALQFHALCESKNIDLHREWYVAGHAHALSRHTWNGRELVLRARLLTEPFDYPKAARERIEADPSDWHRHIVGEFPDPTACWAAVGLCMEGGRGRYKVAYDKYVIAKTGSKLPGDDFLRALGPKEQIVRDLYVWLEDQQTPFEMVTDGFEDRGGRVLRAQTADDRRAQCILKEDADVIECDLGEVPKLRAKPGIVTGYTGQRDLVLITAVAPNVRVDVYQDGKNVWSELLEIPGDHVQVRHMRVVRKGPACSIEVDGIDLGTREVPRGRQGFFVEGGPVEFRDVRWE